MRASRYYTLHAAKQGVVAVNKMHDVIADVIRTGSAIREESLDTRHTTKENIALKYCFITTRNVGEEAF